MSHTMDQQGQPELKRPTLLTLPLEIQTKILSHLAAPFGKSTIQAVLRTCKRLYEVALPISVSIFRNTVHYFKGRGPCSRDRNTQFLRYILVSKPWLAKHVETVIFGEISSEDGDMNHDTEDDGELAVYQQHIEFFLGQLPSGYIDDWCNLWAMDLKRGASDAQVALILLTCPNIRSLLFEMSKHTRHFIRLLNLAHNLVDINTSIHTSGSEWGNGRYPDMIIPLSNVQDVFHETMDYDNGYSEFHVEAPELFSLPQLRFYECILARADDSAARNFGCLPRRSSSVEEITLHCSSSTGRALKNMLGSCRALKKFEFTHYGYHTTDLMLPRDILDAILPHADTLESLYLNLEEDWDKSWNWYNCPERLYMGMELRQMRALKKLTSGMQALTGMLAAKPENHAAVIHQMPLDIEGAATLVNCLPDNLEYLKIRGCGIGIVDQVAELIRVVEQGHRFKRLTYIGLLFNGWKNEEEVNASQVSLTCKAPNVVLDIGFQDHIRAMYDLGQRSGDRGKGQERNCASRIYAQNIRQYYLKLRGFSEFPDSLPEFTDEPELYEEWSDK